MEGRCDHLLIDIMMVAVWAVLSGAESRSEVEQFGESKLVRLKLCLELARGIPLHDALKHVMRRLEATFAIQRGHRGRWESGMRQSK